MVMEQHAVNSTANSEGIHQCFTLKADINGALHGVAYMTTNNITQLSERLTELITARAKIVPNGDQYKAIDDDVTSGLMQRVNSGAVSPDKVKNLIKAGLIEKIPQVMTPELTAINEEITEILSEINKAAKPQKAIKNGSGTRVPRVSADIIERNKKYVESLNADKKVQFSIELLESGKISVLNRTVSDPITVQRILTDKGYAQDTKSALVLLRTP